MGGGYDLKTASIIESTISNTLLTDYLSFAKSDMNIHRFENQEVYAPENSITMYKMYSSYLNIVPKEEIPIDLNELNKALLGDRGYYQMLMESEHSSKSVLRFNINAFKNSYSLADLLKMKLTYYGIKVGSCTEDQLSLENEFTTGRREDEVSAIQIVTGVTETNMEYLNVYDVVLAGVISE